ncbi:MAG TPA: hypothetical protein VIJ17_10665, partial [Pseudolabrys sp.]
LLVDRKLWLSHGAMALRWTGERFELSAARPPGYQRPWARAQLGTAEAVPSSTRPAVRDATPRTEDLEAGD